MDFLRQLVKFYDTTADEQNPAELRNRVMAQPHIIAMRGRLSLIRNELLRMFGKFPLFVFGRNRVVRFQDGSSANDYNGFAWDGIVTADVLTSGSTSTMKFYTQNAQGDYADNAWVWTSTTKPTWLIGRSIKISSSSYEILSLDNTDTVTVIGSPAVALVHGCTVYETRGRIYDFFDSFYSPDADVAFNDKGLFISPLSDITVQQNKDMLRLFDDYRPGSETWVLAGESPELE
jgi:hypothetical protein